MNQIVLISNKEEINKLNSQIKLKNKLISESKCPTYSSGKQPSCPTDTIECSNYKGYCYNPNTNKILSTYNDSEHACPELGTPGSEPFLLNNTSVWYKTSCKDKQIVLI
jgi:hypothetical protein